MLTVGVIPVLSRILSNLDLKPILPILEKADIFDDKGAKKGALNNIKNGEAVKLGTKIAIELMPQFGKIGADVPEFVAMYKDISIEEAKKLDFIEIVKEVLKDTGLMTFFESALRQKVEQES